MGWIYRAGGFFDAKWFLGGVLVWRGWQQPSWHAAPAPAAGAGTRYRDGGGGRGRGRLFRASRRWQHCVDAATLQLLSCQHVHSQPHVEWHLPNVPEQIHLPLARLAALWLVILVVQHGVPGAHVPAVLVVALAATPTVRKL